MSCAMVAIAVGLMAGAVGFLSFRSKGSDGRAVVAFVLCAALLGFGALDLIAQAGEKRRASEAAVEQGRQEELKAAEFLRAQEEQREATRGRADEIFDTAKSLRKKRKYAEAGAELERLADAVPAYPGLVEILAENRADIEFEKRQALMREEKERRKGEEAVRLVTRRSMEHTLRTTFLDNGLDIKVKVSGSKSDRIKFTHVLFNDVWSHRFQKDGTISKLCDAGFKRIDMSSGYDWAVYWDCN